MAGGPAPREHPAGGLWTVTPLEPALMTLIVAATGIVGASAEATRTGDGPPSWNDAQLAGQPVDISPWSYPRAS